jgi:o-succinylbenzoate---CoA ligase
MGTDRLMRSDRGVRIPLPLPRQARFQAGQPALVTEGVSLSYGALGAEADLCAARLATLGIGPGDRVAVCLPGGLAFATLLHAVARLEAVLVPLNTRLTAANLAWQVADCQPRVVVWDPSLTDRVPGVPAGVSVLAARAPAPGETAIDAPLLADTAPGDTALVDTVNPDLPYTIVYTSGTTGQARGAVLSHGNHLWSALGSAMRLGVVAGDRWLAPLPLFHVGGLSVLLRAAFYGTTAVLPSRFDAAEVARSLREDGITHVSLVPTMLKRLLDAWGDEAAPASLRAVLLGGGPAAPELVADARARGFAIALTYGLTESASQVATAPPSSDPLAPDALPPLPFNEIRVVDEGGADAPVGVEGEILVRGPSVMNAYWRSPDVTDLALAGGWLHTRDVGSLDGAGRLTVVGRRGDMIITGGENVHPVGVETVLDAHPGVSESCVVGIPDPEWGAIVVAAVVRAPGSTVTPAELQAHARAHLAGYKVPRRIVWVADLPRTPAGKVQRIVVREEILRAGGGDRPD